MSTRGNICVKVKEDDYYRVNQKVKGLVYKEFPYIFIYNHFDSYPEGLGATLKKDYNSYEKALDLVLEGDCSYPGKPYAEREDYSEVAPRVTNSIEKACQQEYLYVFQNDVWEIYNNELEKI